jgi:GGDEF domain-containing protein
LTKKSKIMSAKIDIYFVLLASATFALLFVTKFVDIGSDTTFVVMLDLLYIFVVVSYFSSMIVSIIACFVFVFGYGSYILYLAVFAQKTVNPISCFWIIVIPVFCIITSFYRNYLLEIQEKITTLNDSVELLSGFDEDTNLLNERMFYYQLKRYMAMANRGYINVCVMVVKLKYYNDIKKLVGKQSMANIMSGIGSIIGDATRLEDTQFVVDENGIFSLIVICDMNGAEIIKSRVKEKVKKMELIGRLKIYNLDLELKIGIAQCSKDISSEIELKKLADKTMEYDV